MNFDEVGKRIFVLVNSVCLLGVLCGYFVFGVEDDLWRVVGINKYFGE